MDITKSTITITFGDQAENHAGMEIVGKEATYGFSKEDLLETKSNFENAGCKTEFIKLHEFAGDAYDVEKAYVLVIRGGIETILSENTKVLWDEQDELELDKKAKMRGRVVNKRARWNLVFSDKEQEPDYENGKGRIVHFDDVLYLKQIRELLPLYFGDKAMELQAEGNYYYDSKQCGIGFHGDGERKIVIGARLGVDMPLVYYWYKNSTRFGERCEINLSDGDMYVMSIKATGRDWKKRKVATLRHAAGCAKYTK